MSRKHVRIEGDFWRIHHGRVSVVADGIYIRMASYAAESADGLVHPSMVSGLCGGKLNRKALAELVAAGRIERCSDGFRVLGPVRIVELSRARRDGLSAATRFAVLTRDGFKCVYCGAQADAGALHVDHVKPVSQGGANDPANLVTACEACNLGKADSVLQ